MRRALGVGMPFLLLVFSLVTVPIRLLGPDGLARYHTLQKELLSISAYNAALRHQTRRLMYQVEQLRRSPDAMDHVARDELGWVGPSDVLIHFGK